MSVDLTGPVILGGVILAAFSATHRPADLRIAAALAVATAIGIAVVFRVTGDPAVARFVLGVLPWGLFGLAAGEAGRRAEDRP